MVGEELTEQLCSLAALGEDFAGGICNPAAEAMEVSSERDTVSALLLTLPCVKEVQVQPQVHVHVPAQRHVQVQVYVQVQQQLQIEAQVPKTKNSNNKLTRSFSVS